MIHPLESKMPEPNTEIHLDAAEQQLLEDLEQGALQSVATSALLEDLRQSARATGQKDQRINFASPAVICRPSAPERSRKAFRTRP